jgi:antitoxin FitA
VSTIQLKNVPPDVHAELKRRAARSRMSVRDYVLRLIEADQQVMPLAEWLAAIASRKPPTAIDVDVDVDVVELIRRGREERTAQILRALDETADR